MGRCSVPRMTDIVAEAADSIRSSIDSEALARRAIRVTIQHIIGEVDALATAGHPNIPVDHWLATLHHVRGILVAEMDEAIGEPGDTAPLF